VFANITKERITRILEDTFPLGKIERIDIVSVNDSINRVFIHFEYWYDTDFVKEFKKLIEDSTTQAKIVYDEPWFWIVLKNTHRIATGECKKRINIDSPTTPPTPPQSPSKVVSFVSSVANTKKTKKHFKDIRWADYSSDEESDDETPIQQEPIIQHYQIPILPTPQFPMYAYNYMHIPQQYYPYIPQYQPTHYFCPIAPGISFQEPHPVSSWNGISMDEEIHLQQTLQDYEMLDAYDNIDEVVLTQQDYQEIIDEMADDCDDLYSDEDLYNMWLLEKEELALINQTAIIYDKVVSEPNVVMEEIYGQPDTFEYQATDAQLYLDKQDELSIPLQDRPIEFLKSVSYKDVLTQRPVSIKRSISQVLSKIGVM
jgi:hypothetical protein